MNINKKIKRLEILSDLLKILNSKEESAKEDNEYQKSCMENEESSIWREENIKDNNDRIEAICELRKELEKLA